MGGGSSAPSAENKEAARIRDERNGILREGDDFYNQGNQFHNEATNYANEYRQSQINYEADIKKNSATNVLYTTIQNTQNISNINTIYNKHNSDKNKFFNNNNKPIENTFGMLIDKTKEQIDNLIIDVSNQNIYIASQIQENKANENHSKKVKSEFQKKKIEKLTNQNKIIWYVFYVLVLILGLVMWYYDTVNMISQIIIFHVLLVYPFLIYYFELLLYIIYSYSRSFFESTPFNKVYLGN